ncbi:MAG: hypothetical protein ABSF83_04950 [Nitrososphaerales archaeon]|jgi:hypothetical protein
MSATSGTASSQTFLLIFAFIILMAIRRVYRTYRGTRFSVGRTIIFAAVYVGLGLLFSAGSFYEGVPVLLAPLYALLLAGAAAASYRYADRRITFWRGSDGSLYFRGGVVIYLIYLAALLIRLAIDYAVIGPDVFNFSFSPGSALTGTALYGTVATDLLLMFGVGLLLGRNLRVLRRYRRIAGGQDAVPETPSPLGGGGGGTVGQL